MISPDKEDWSIGESSEARDLVALMQTVLWFAKQMLRHPESRSLTFWVANI
ncbi:hypothetical protein ACFSO7_11805 [Bacillus sp. CGMCC 1.16607]|uniref:hypothetical protein n=1 Tax=Bacillus sp. CGMCC 1.16607 TaxID=3351842 RepID=UPI00363D7B5C